MTDDFPKPGDPNFEALKAELQRAFATPDSEYIAITAEEFLVRMRLKRSATVEERRAKSSKSD